MKTFARKVSITLILLLATLLPLPACSPAPANGASQAGRLSVVATTTIVGDVVQNIGGTAVEISVLLPPNVDPHGFEPAPKDVAKMAEAEVIFANGAGLETFLEPLLANAGGRAETVYVSEGVQLLQAQELHGEAEHEGEDSDGDPHTWFDPNNVKIWAQNIERKLSALDPANAQVYAANSQEYQDRLDELDGWIQEQVAQIPEANRKLVSDHTSFTYFAARYGFEQVGAIIPSYSTLAQPSAQELANLEDAIRSLGVKAVFMEKSVNPALAERVAEDTGVRLVFLYNGSLSGPDGPAATYLDFMKYNVSALVDGLK